jgi:ABC-2 type transport system ATP-binding protein
MQHLTCRTLSFAYPGFTLGPISLSFEPGIIGLIGENGAGKTTLMAALGGMLPGLTGEIFLSGDILSAKARRQRVAFAALRDVLYPSLSFSEHLRFLRTFYPTWSLEIERDLVRRFNIPTEKRAGAASSGTKSKFWLLVALARRADAILFDEPWNTLDPAGRDDFSSELRAIAKEANIPIIVSSHELEQLERIIDSFHIISEGRIVSSGDRSVLGETRERERVSPLRKAYLEAHS